MNKMNAYIFSIIANLVPKHKILLYKIARAKGFRNWKLSTFDRDQLGYGNFLKCCKIGWLQGVKKCLVKGDINKGIYNAAKYNHEKLIKFLRHQSNENFIVYGAARSANKKLLEEYQEKFIGYSYKIIFEKACKSGNLEFVKHIGDNIFYMSTDIVQISVKKNFTDIAIYLINGNKKLITLNSIYHAAYNDNFLLLKYLCDTLTKKDMSDVIQYIHQIVQKVGNRNFCYRIRNNNPGVRDIINSVVGEIDENKYKKICNLFRLVNL